MLSVLKSLRPWQAVVLVLAPIAIVGAIVGVYVLAPLRSVIGGAKIGGYTLGSGVRLRGGKNQGVCTVTPSYPIWARVPLSGGMPAQGIDVREESGIPAQTLHSPHSSSDPVSVIC